MGNDTEIMTNLLEFMLMDTKNGGLMDNYIEIMINLLLFMLMGDKNGLLMANDTEITINLSHDGQAEQFSLAASPDANDPPGQSSRFVSSSAELAEELDHDHGEAQLVATINGKQFRGAVAHDHDHEGHDHDHQ